MSGARSRGRPGCVAGPGGKDVIDWITAGTEPGPSILSAIPPGFASYASIVIPDGDAAKTQADAALVETLRAHTPEQPWWLGYLDTGVADLVDPAAARVPLYVGWPYVLLGAVRSGR